MAEAIDDLAVYLHLAKAAWKKLQMQDRDRLLVIGGAFASEIGLPSIAQYCRLLILRNNPGHMVRKWPNFRLAMEDGDFLYFIKQVHRRFPIEKAESMLEGLGIDRANERATYYSDLEYAAAILGLDIPALERELSESGPGTDAQDDSASDSGADPG